MKTLIPLQQSHTYNSYESELRDLFIKLFQAALAERAADVNCYAAPHLGSEQLLRKYLVSQNIANFNNEEIHVDNLRYLTETWRYLNPKRGVHFLKAFISLIWGNEFRIEQLLQKQGDDYPLNLAAENEIRDPQNYFLTSRLRIVLLGLNRSFSEGIAKELNSLLPARLFVDEIIKVIESKSNFFVADSGVMWSLSHGEVTEIIPPTILKSDYLFADGSNIYSITHGVASEVVPPVKLNTDFNLQDSTKLLSISSGVIYDHT